MIELNRSCCSSVNLPSIISEVTYISVKASFVLIHNSWRCSAAISTPMDWALEARPWRIVSWRGATWLRISKATSEKVGFRWDKRVRSSGKIRAARRRLRGFDNWRRRWTKTDLSLRDIASSNISSEMEVNFICHGQGKDCQNLVDYLYHGESQWETICHTIFEITIEREL